MKWKASLKDALGSKQPSGNTTGATDSPVASPRALLAQSAHSLVSGEYFELGTVFFFLSSVNLTVG